jgi:hypothetical protein
MPSRSTKGFEQQVYEDWLSYKNPTEVAKPIIADSCDLPTQESISIKSACGDYNHRCEENSVATNSRDIGSCGTPASAALEATGPAPCFID